jgi:hypothetical protein
MFDRAEERERAAFVSEAESDDSDDSDKSSDDEGGVVEMREGMQGRM